MRKTYKGYELVQAIAGGKIKIEETAVMPDQGMRFQYYYQS